MPADGVGETVAVATVSVTFDNLGEAAELERGTWPEGEPLGEHFSVRECLPELLALLAREDLRATFFVEGLNGGLYPDALAGLRAAGHEVACHGWRHESWREVGDRERELLARARDALGAPAGFRPPGGRLNAGTPELLRELGFRYCSPAGSRAGRLDGVATLPFRWTLIDAYFYLPHFAPLRQRNGDPEAPMEPAVLRERVLAALDAHTEGHLALIFHPFLLTAAPEALSVVADVLARAAEFRCLRMDEAAAALPADAGPPELDDTSWNA
jgi:peptidoglycan/xylan/chitin deacetylase (PgdA/CDA1 family)